MTGINNILPFLEHARTIRTRNYRIKNEDLYLTKALEVRVPMMGKVSDAYKHSLSAKIPTVYLVRPLGMLVMKGTDFDICAYKAFFKEILCTIVEVDYTSVASAVEVIHGDDRVVARFPYLNGFIEEELASTLLIDYTISGDVLYKPSFGYGPSIRYDQTETSEPSSDELRAKEPIPLLEWEDTTDKFSPLNEAVTLEDFTQVSPYEAMSVQGTKTPQTIRLESYFTGGYVTNRTPLLVGPSAVAKSAMVKSLTQKYGMRLVDVRLAFTSRLDIEGLTGRLEKDGVIMSEASPASFMLECSDAYIDFCRDALITLTKAQEDEKDEAKKKVYQESIDKFREGAKIPVLFLDEVTRAPASVRQAFTKILSDKEFMGYPMSYARVIAATNVALGAPEELQGIYQTQDVGDAAFYDRFESIQIYPDEVYNDWVTWGTSQNEEGRQNIHPIIMDMLAVNKTQAYNFNFLYDVYMETQNEDDVTSSPYPNYRTWELVSNYIYEQEESQVYMSSIIQGLVGDEAAKLLIQELNFKNWSEKAKTDDSLSDVIEQGMNTGTPIMMITPSSIGKSARIKSIASSRNAYLIDINLAEQDRVDLLGPPVRVPVEKFVASSIVTLPDEVQKQIKESVKKYELPSHVTIKAPKEEIITKLKEAASQGREVIVHFDELNRVQNPSVMSSVFECISDHRVLGVKFDPKNVRVFASCNMGENYADAQSLDPAFSARFVMYKRTSYEESDVKAFISYMEKKKFSPYILEFFKSRPYSDVVNILASVETRSLELSSASTRAWEDLDKFLKDEVNKNVCKGTVLFSSDSEARAYQNFMEVRSVDRYKTITSIVDSKIENWAGNNSDMRIPISVANGKKETVSAKEIVSLYKEAKTAVDKALETGKDPQLEMKVLSNVLLYLFSANREITNVRSKIFKMALGPHAEAFGGYYNEVSGTDTSVIEIDDCTDIEKFHKYVAQEIRGISLPKEVAFKLMSVTKEFAKTFSSVSNERAVDVLNHCINCITTTEAKGEYLRGIANDRAVENLIVVAENQDINFAINLLKRAGINVTNDDVTKAKKVVRQVRIK